MKHAKDIFVMKMELPSASPTARCYRLPSFPPPPDWPVVEDADGNVISLWGDAFWDWTPFHGKKMKIHFNRDIHGSTGGMRTEPISAENEWDLRLIVTTMIYGPHGITNANVLKLDFHLIRRVVSFCEDNGIRVRDLGRFPTVWKSLAKVTRNARSRERLILILDRLLQSKEELGFAILESRDIAKLAEVFANSTATGAREDTEQVAYIPPRLYIYTLNRQRECIDDFLANQEKIAQCFEFCLDAYVHNFGSLQAAIEKTNGAQMPFTKPSKKSISKAIRLGFYRGTFHDTAKRFKIAGLLAKWVAADIDDDETDEGVTSLKMFCSYLNLINSVCLPYIGAFTFQRKEELGALRSDCLIWERDPIVGPIPIICGETTKTDPDNDARWPTSPHVAVAVEAANAVARMRMTAVVDATSPSNKALTSNPLLFSPPTEPWSSSRSKGKVHNYRSSVQSYAQIIAAHTKLFDPDVLKMTEEDLVHARRFTPNLDKKGAFAVGKPWPFSYHQLRRTGGINMYASGLLSETSIQVLLKHLVIYQTRYYRQHFSSARINETRQAMVVSSAYLVLAKQLKASVEDRFVSPAGNSLEQDKEIHLISESDYKKLIAAANRDEISFRGTTLGGCVTRGDCQYGGIESIARCAGGDGGKPCQDAKLDKAKREFVADLLANYVIQQMQFQPGTRRYEALQMEISACRNYLELTAD
ncbi:hypothetical protein [Herbaspirillum seropedicae]|uniref:Integrase n=1 Tax=Herbaspirillum seropedicae (strain SmR1) TaxID=757424 RepID=D8ITE4_HERSS|nr:hypothetical protein [Herbaspirillum seropedicae]ADJ65574.1 conserved hypothetical protein [Herbaspirillum seropedicae SmR1]AKN67399.1 hypothetical protein ACP92_20495 [Herbaspirillum seropedicae]NQE31991.1 hypothetical protein [Herbaspirillum seropedicae]